ncbi:VanZ family protein [Paraclostridium bifermentans]|uniref:VanZ family protein n=1 Tax=Paraclostridium bifermentans TaxID=1490 RepID=UPI00359CB89B
MIIEFNLVVLIAFVAIYAFFRGLCLFIENKDIKFKNEIINFGLYMSVVAVFAATLFPIRLGLEFEGFEVYNLIPFKVPIMLYNKYGLGYFLYQILGNILLFVPFGFFVYNKTGFNMKRAILACLSLTLFVEITQGFIPYRFCEIDDIWLNTLGGTIGAYFYYVCLKIKNKYDLLIQKSS